MIDDAGERRVSVEQRVQALEKTVFGQLDLNTNSFIDGLLQIAADTRRDVRMIMRAGIVVLVILLAIVTKQYGLLDFLKAVF